MRKGKNLRSNTFQRRAEERRRQYRATRVKEMVKCSACESLWPQKDLRTGKCPICIGRFNR